MKDWTKYGMSRTLNQLFMENAEQMKRAEIEAEGKKSGRDWSTIAVVAVIVMIGAGVAYMFIMQYSNVSALQEEIKQEKISTGECMGKLANCEVQLDQYIPDKPSEVIPL